MEITRLVELSLIYSLKSHLSVRKTNESPATTDNKTFRLKYADITEDKEVLVLVGGAPPSVDYKVNYRDGLIIFDSPLASSSDLRVSYSYCKINVYDEGKNPFTDDNFQYPAISIYEINREDEGYELGSGRKEKNSHWGIEVWTERGGERHDISDSIINFFEEDNSPIIDYNKSFPLDSNGFKNPAYNKESQVRGYMSCDSINKDNGGSLGIGDKPKYMSEIVVELSYI
jgi:hypothetical protein